ncbi:MAG: DUF4350 domain-containing protein [Nodosilinea sp.]
MSLSLPTWNRRRLGLGLLALGVLLLAVVLVTPAAGHVNRGSTWSRSPAGYSAWYESLESQNIPVQRWQRPITELLSQLDGGIPEGTTTLIQTSPDAVATLVVVLPGFVDETSLFTLLPWLPSWIESDHRLVVLGLKNPVTAAPFSQTLPTARGPVALDTRRRQKLQPEQSLILGDDYGAVVWQLEEGASEVILAATPNLGANAYLNSAGNFALLTDLVTRQGGSVWVDEYLHGYRDGDAIAAEVGGNSWLHYLARTPLVVLAAQILAVTLLALLAQNRRLGQCQTLSAPVIDNSQAYITALAGVLYKANSHDFVRQTLAQAERLRLQKSLGLGDTPVTNAQLETAWIQQRGGTASDLAVLLHPPVIRQEAQLRAWLKPLQSLHQRIQETSATHE